MKKKLQIILLIILCLFSFSCKSKDKENSKKSIVFSFKPYALVMKDYGTVNYKVDILFESQRDIKRNTLSARQLKKIKKADLVVLNGYFEDKFAEQLLPYQSKIVYVSNLINQVKLSKDKQHPWYWLNLDLYMDYVRGLNSHLGRINPYYHELHNQKTLELIEKDQQFLSNMVRKKVSYKAQFENDLNYLAEYFNDHLLFNHQIQEKKVKTIGISDHADIQVDLWGDQSYTDMFDYYHQLYQKLFTQAE